jgi:hypothetical protein
MLRRSSSVAATAFMYGAATNPVGRTLPNAAPPNSAGTKASCLQRSRQTRKINSGNGFRDRSHASIEIKTDPSGPFPAQT